MYCQFHKKLHEHHHRGCARKSPSSDSSSTSSSDSETLSRVDLFRQHADELRLNRDSLLEKFPKVVWFPNKNDMEWCSFCLGSRVCLEIYGEQTEGEKATYFRKLPHRRFPLLSVVLHLRQEKVKLLLHYLHQWFLMKGLKNVISMWMYALLACLDEDSINAECSNFLKTLYIDCKKYLKSCEEWQKPRASLIMDILEEYFSVDVPDSDFE